METTVPSGRQNTPSKAAEPDPAQQQPQFGTAGLSQNLIQVLIEIKEKGKTKKKCTAMNGLNKRRKILTAEPDPVRQIEKPDVEVYL